ncbi:hypothetical protein [Paenibacillus nuruki]|uniref:hypothetical protein n=1 Tax=Paenibacillus nuruki TaxID=1886670 RepID=UPI002803C8C2|nr:hypothetical protein [Paenibacillus nuruki]CAJ1314513.1 hypothetical protein AASFL403_04855 [Paenibacillus nuruki]
MEYLKQYVGKNIYVDLTKEGKADKILKMVYDVDRHQDLLGDKLLGVDSIGIWLEGFHNVTYFYDTEGNPISENNQVSKKEELSVLVRYEYIKGIMLINDQTVNQKIGFSN